MESGLDKGGQGDNGVSVSLSVSGSSSSSALIRGGQIIGTSGAEGGGADWCARSELVKQVVS